MRKNKIIPADPKTVSFPIVGIGGSAGGLAESIIETMLESLVVLGDDLKVISANGAFYRTFKVNPKETEGQFIYDLGNRQWDIPKLRHLLENILLKESSFNNYEIKHSFETVGQKTMLLNARRVVNMHVILIAIDDITERKRAEERLAEEKKNLEKVNLELDSFVYTASHDLRAPLRGMSAYATFLEEDYSDKLDEKGKDYLNGIRKAAGRMDEMIEGLLTLSRLPRIQNPYEEVNLKDLLDSILQRIEFDIRELKVDLRIQANLPMITCDRIKIGEVFVNLVNNAVKFSSKNNEEHPKVEIGYHDKKEAHEFYVKDNGIGIDPQYHQRIFGLFEHLHPAEQYKGAGLGLNIVKRVIEDQGGKVWVESALGKGATFYFTIPRSLKT